MGNSCGCVRSKQKTKEGRSPKIRKKSKAHSSGVQEGDVVVNVNGKSVEGQSHMATMEMVDNSGETLVLGIKRGGQAQSTPKVVNKPSPAVTTPQPVGGPASKNESVTVTSATTTVAQNGDGHTGTYSETLLGREAKLVKEERKVEQVRIEETQTSIDNATIPVAVIPVATIPAATVAISTTPISTAPSPVIPTSTQPARTNGTALLDDTLSKLETFPKVTDAFATCSESFEHVSIANEQVTSNFPTETVTAELKEDFKENIAPVQFNDYPIPTTAAHVPPTFNVKQIDVNKSVWQPASSSLGVRPQQPRGPSAIEMQRSKFQKQAPPPPKTKPKPNRMKGQGSYPLPFQPLQQVYQPQNFQPAPNFQQPATNAKHQRKIPPVFGPPVTISIGDQREHSDLSSPDSSGITKKKLFSDSAFYDDPNAVYPTIDEQMKLCKSIALSLTSDANKKARGARMFAKRQKRAPKWIHEGDMSTSSGGDVGNVDDLDSELSCDEGGTKPLFTFKIPRLANQKSDPGKMSLTQDEFERLRLDKQRCEHKTVSPNTCFNLVADLTSAKGRGAKIFEKRRAKAEEWVVDESNVPKNVKPSPLSPGGRLADMLNSPPKPMKSPWEAALENPYGSVDAAFQHLSEYEKMQLMNRNPLMPAMEPAPVPMHSKLPPGEKAALLQGPKFNRTAKGWRPIEGGQPVEDLGIDYSRYNRNPPTMEPETTSRQQVQYRDYNPKPRAWKAPEPTPQPRLQQQQQQPQQYSHSTSSSMSYSNQSGRWPASQASNSYSSYNQQSYSMGQPQYGYGQQRQQQQQQSMFGTDL